MAVPTLPGDEKQENKLNPSQNDYDRRFNGNLSPDERQKFDDIARAEEQGSFDEIANNYDKTADSSQVDGNIRRLQDRESQGDTTAGNKIVNNFTGANNKGKKQKLTGIKIAKRVGIFGGAGGIIGIVIAIISGFLPIAGIVLNLSEVATANRDTQNNVLTRRLYKVIDSKMTGDVTNGSCNVVKVACRFSRPSNAFLSRLDEYGIKAYNGDTPVEKKALGFPNQSPTEYRFTNANNEEIKVAPKDFVKTLQTNTEFRKLFTGAYNMRYWGYADSVIKKLFYKPMGIDRSGKTTTSVDPNDPQKSIQSIADGVDSDNKVKAAGSEDGAKVAATEAIDEAATAEVKTGLSKIAKSGGDPILAAGIGGCIAINLPGIYTKVARAYQMRQEIVLAGAIVLTAASMMKSGDMDPSTMAVIGGLLTSTAVASNGVPGKSAMDSFGIKSILFNDSRSSSDSYKKFIPGGAAMKSTAGINAFAQSPAVKQSCETIASPGTQVAVSAVEAGIGAASGGIGFVVFKGLQAATVGILTIVGVDALVDAASPLISTGVQTLMASIPPEAVAEAFGNKDITNAKNEDLGNVLGAGLSFFFSNANLSTTGSVAKVEQLPAIAQSSQETMIAYAEQDRLGRSPLDASSPYTFLGSIVANYGQNAYVPGSTIKTVLSSVGYTLSAPFKMLSSNTYAASDNLSAVYSHAEEFGVDPSVAVGPFSELYSGIDPQYLNASTQDVLNSVTPEIDEDSGQPKSDGKIQEVLDTCGKADLMNAKGCTIESQERANLSIYPDDIRISDMLDGINTDEDTDDSATTASAGRPENTVDSGKGWTTKDNTDYSSVQCDPRTTDIGVNTNPNFGTTIRMCAVPFNSGASSLTSASSGDSSIVSSLISTNAMNMLEAAKAAGVSLGISDGFRAAGGSDYTASSKHSRGLAMDLGTPGGGQTFCFLAGGWGDAASAEAACKSIGGAQYQAFQWLKENAATYGFYNLQSEPWHWSPAES